MKAKTLIKKLHLSKETISNLESGEQQAIKGGRPATSYNDPRNCYTDCDTGICCVEF